MDDRVILISTTVTKDDIGNEILEESGREIFCEILDVYQNEFFAAAQNNINAKYKLKIWGADYNNERLAEINGEKFSVYRTFKKGEYLELYLQTKVALNGNEC